MLNERLEDIQGNPIDYFEIEQALGHYEGVVRYSKFGRNLSITSSSVYADIWDRTHTLTYLDNETTLYAVSSNIADTMKIQIDGVDGDYNFQQTTTTLNGTTPVTIGGSWLRVFNVRVLGTTAKQGELFISTSNSATPADNTIQAYCPSTCQRSLMTHLTVPKGYVALIKSYTVSSNKGKDIQARAMIRTLGNQFISEEEVGLFETTIQLQTHFFRVPPKSDIKFQAITSQPTAQCYIAYTAYLFPEIYFKEQKIIGNYI